MLEEPRLLELEERINLALMYNDQIEELHDVCYPSVKLAMRDSDKVHRIMVLLSQHKVPVMSTELTEEQAEALRTGAKPTSNRPKIRVHYHGVLGDKDGKLLNELFNLGTFTQVGDSTPRPMSTWCLAVPEDKGFQLETVHRAWTKSRICLLVETGEGFFWVTPNPVNPHGTTQHYTVAQSSEAIAPNRPPLQRGSVIAGETARSADWRDAMDELILRKPELGFVHLILSYLLQPAHVQLINQSQIGNKVLMLIYQGVMYRVVGITNSGMLLLTRRLDQGLVYETTISFLDVVRHSSTIWKQKDGE